MCDCLVPRQEGSVWLQDDKWDDRSLLTRMPTIRTQSPHIYLKWLLSSKFETGGFIWVQDEGRIGRAHPKHKINVYTHRQLALRWRAVLRCRESVLLVAKLRVFFHMCQPRWSTIARELWGLVVGRSLIVEHCQLKPEASGSILHDSHIFTSISQICLTVCKSA